MNGWWIGASNSKPACLFEDVTLMKEWLPEFQKILTKKDWTVFDKVKYFID